MISFEEAIKIVENELNRINKISEIEVAIYHPLTVKKEKYWMFIYNDIRNIKAGEILFPLAGNAPIIIENSKGELFHTGTFNNPEYYLKKFEKLLEQYPNDFEEIRKKMSVI